MPIVTATLAMPLCPTRHTALPALISLAFGPWTQLDQLSGGLDSNPPTSDFGSCPVTHCQLAQPACLLAGEDPSQTPLPFACLFIFLFSLAPLRNPAPDYPTPGKMWITLPSRSCPLLASLVPPIGRTCSLCIIIWSNWAFSVFLWPSYVSFFPTSLVCSLHSRLVICSVQSLRLVHPQLALFPTDQLPLPTSMTSYRSHASPVRLGRPSGALHVSHYFYAHTSQDHCNCRCTCWREHPLTMSVSQPFF